jgi:hypothetical protein
MGKMTDEIPTTIKRLKILEPITFPREIALFELTLAEMLMAASGILVPRDTTVRPMISDGTLSLVAIDEAPSTKKSAPLIRKTKPTISQT